MNADDLARIFNNGSDARLRGEPRTANPYKSHGQEKEYRQWQAGFDDVHHHWGSEYLHGWRPRPLPQLMGTR